MLNKLVRLSVDILFAEANKLLNTIYIWFCNNKLKLNLIKSKYICFELQATNYSNCLLRNNLIVHSLKCNYHLSATCTFNCIILEKVNEIKYLGIIVDYRFKWESHINYINNTLRKFFYFFKEARYLFNNYYKIMIFLALVQSVYSYGISIWGGAANNVLSKLIVTINGIIKFLLNLPMITSTSLIYKEFNVKHLICIYKSSVLVDLYKHKKLITLLDHEHNTRYKKNINILLPNLNKVFGQHSILYIGLGLCSSLNININNFENGLLFKNYVKHLDLSTI